MADSTRLRFVSSKDIDNLLGWVNSLPYKIEIKGNPVLNKSKWFLFFVIPEDLELKEEVLGTDID